MSNDAGVADATGAAAPPESRPTPAERVTAAVEVVLASGFPTQLVLGAALVAMGLGPWDASGALSLPYLTTVLVLDAALVVAIILIALRAHGERPSAIFLGGRPPAREAWLGAALLPLVIGGTAGLMAALRWAWPVLHNVPTNPFEAVIQTPADALILGAAAVLGGGVKEEVQRAFILRRFDRYLGGAVPGLALYSLAFGAGHALQGWDVAVMTVVLGVAWGAVYLWRRSAVAPMVSHAGFNAAQIIQFLVFRA